jgi:toxin ParE1/3/4
VNYWLHPEAAQEHKNQVAYYEQIQAGLGKRYHTAFIDCLSRIQANPTSFRIVVSPDIRRTMFKVFQFDVIYRQVEGVVQILAIAHHRRQPAYWQGRA